MIHKFFLCASGPNAGLTSIALGTARALDRLGVRVAFCKPISQEQQVETRVDASILLAEHLFSIKPPQPINLAEAERYLREGRSDDLMERVVEMVESLSAQADVVVVEGLLSTEGQSFKNRLNRDMAKALGAEVIFVGQYQFGNYKAFYQEVEVAATLFGGVNHPSVIGCIANRVALKDEKAQGVASNLPVLFDEAANSSERDQKEAAQAIREECELIRSKCHVMEAQDFSLLGCVPDNPGLRSARMVDVANELGAQILHRGNLQSRRVRSMALCARNVPNMLHVLQPGALIVVPGDRNDVIMAVALASINKVPLAGLILTGKMDLDERILDLCRNGLEGTGLPVLRVHLDSFQTASNLANISPAVPSDDFERIGHVVDFIARNLNHGWFKERIVQKLSTRLSPAAFRYQLAFKARAQLKRIVLPEGEEPRTIIAAAACVERGIADCVLLGDPEEIRRVAAANAVVLPREMTLIDASAVRDRYFGPLMERRKGKGLSEERGKEALEDNVVLGTMMLALGEVDGLVSGAVHSSASTIRPALQLIKTKPEAKVVSSVFFMCLPDEVLVYGDCAVNPDPDASALADIAIQSAETAIQFGIEPRIALISYSTGESGSGVDVEKVREATRLAKAQRPDLLIDGPLQYDAAAIPDVAEKKAPASPLGGRATVFIFPDLNTGNTTYKAVQRSANLISIGPILQGLNKPVNDLSRGALVDDIIYTIAATAIQAQS